MKKLFETEGDQPKPNAKPECITEVKEGRSLIIKEKTFKGNERKFPVLEPEKEEEAVDRSHTECIKEVVVMEKDEDHDFVLQDGEIEPNP